MTRAPADPAWLADGARAPLPDGGHLVYARAGPPSARPLLLIRPVGGTMALWGAFAARLARTRDVVAYDHRGTGCSSAPPFPLTTLRLARDADALLAALGVAAADVFGLSLGGMVATHLAALPSRRVSRLVLASTPARGAPHAGAALAHTVRVTGCLLHRRGDLAPCLVRSVLSERFRRTHPHAVRRLEARARREPCGRARVGALLAAGMTHDGTAALQRVTAPVLLVRGTDDALVTRADQRQVAQALHEVQCLEIEEAGHDVTLEQPRRTAEAVLAFLDAAG